MIHRLFCRLLGHDHSMVFIFCVATDGSTMQSHRMDRWAADWLLANEIAPTRRFAGREVSSCRIVVP